MSNDLVVKDNVLINASYNLEVTEQRLILLSIITASPMIRASHTAASRLRQM